MSNQESSPSPKELLETLDFSGCLRPVFTESRVHDLLKGRSVNIIGGFHTGKSQTLLDVANTFKLLPNTVVMEANVHSENLKTIDAFTQIIKVEGENLFDIYIDFDAFVTKNKAKKILFVIHNFDKVLQNPQKSFDIEKLLDNLRALKGGKVIFLTCSLHEKIFKNRFTADKKYERSPFHLDRHINLKKLRREELKTLSVTLDKEAFEYIINNNLFEQYFTIINENDCYYRLAENILENAKEKIAYKEQFDLNIIADEEYNNLRSQIKDTSYYTFIHSVVSNLDNTGLLLGPYKPSAKKAGSFIGKFISGLIKRS